MIDVEKEFGPIYMLINCAGSSVSGKLEDTPASDFKVLKTRVFFYLVNFLMQKLINLGGIITEITRIKYFGDYFPDESCCRKYEKSRERNYCDNCFSSRPYSDLWFHRLQYIQICSSGFRRKFRYGGTN
jgi:hypothetical protein